MHRRQSEIDLDRVRIHMMRANSQVSGMISLQDDRR